MTAMTMAARARRIIEGDGPMTYEVFVGHIDASRAQASRVLEHLCREGQISYTRTRRVGLYGWLEPKPKAPRKDKTRGIVGRAVSRLPALATCWGGA